jgi:hypothetical protein
VICFTEPFLAFAADIGSDKCLRQKGNGIMRIIVATILAGIAILGAAPSWAQALNNPPLSRTGRAAQQPPHTLFTIGGFNAVIDAPVRAADSNLGYQNYQGQPMRSGAAILAQAAHLGQ